MHTRNMKNNIELNIIDNAEEHYFKPEHVIVESWIKSSLVNSFDQIKINLVLTTADEMSCLNINFRDKSGPTNVLSFTEENSNKVLSGEIVICSSVAELEAIDKPIYEYFLFLFIHGMLHLQGYDHIEDNEALVMEGLEKKILNNILS